MEILSKICTSGISCVDVQIKEDDGLVTRKKVTLSNYRDIFNESLILIEDMIPIGRIPKGYYFGKLSPSGADSFACVLIIPSGIRPLYYNQTFLIPFPTLVFKFVAIRGRITESYCFSSKITEPTLESKLYSYPFGNVYSEGKICWGSNNLPNVETIGNLDILTSLFFGSPTNDDLYVHVPYGKREQQVFLTQGELLKLLQGKKKFPTRMLRETQITLGDLCK